jgi:hypothetical protein
MGTYAPTALVALAILLAPSPIARAGGSLDTIEEAVEELVPRRTVGYRKGRPLAIEVVTLGWVDVEVRTARAFLAMQAAAAEAGIDLYIRSGFRSHDHQEWLYQAWRAGVGNRAARPGHSNHQSGRALDLYIGDPGTFAWLEANGRRFGFKRTVRGEPWHWEYTRPRKKMKKAKKRSKPERRARRR